MTGAAGATPRRRVLVCGATGFIGRNTVERLAARDDLQLFASGRGDAPELPDRVEWIPADLTREEDVARVCRGADVIVQAAATTSGARDIVERPMLHVTDNAVMNSLIFRAAHEAGVGHLVFFSCTVMYPTRECPSRERPLREEDFDGNGELFPSYFGVGWTKVYLEKMAEFYSRLGTTRYTVLRHSNVYGPHDKYDLERSHVFGATVTKVLTSRDGRVVVWGSGEEARDLLHVDDLVRCVELALDRQREPFLLANVGSGRAVAVRELVERIIAASGRDLRIEHDHGKPTLRTSLALDCARVEAALGWRPQVTLEEGIARTVAWYRQHVAGAAARAVSAP